MVLRATIAGCGGYLPAHRLSNDELAALKGLKTSDAWIRERTGIGYRHFAAEGETASDMGAAAAREALRRAGVEAAEVDAILVATSTPDSAFPATAVRIQASIGATRGFAFDMAAACTGFIYALGVADSLIRTGQARCVLVIGTEVYSRILDWTDRGTCVLFGDGAGAVLLRAAEGAGTTADRGILSFHLHADGRFGDILHIEGGAGSTGGPGLLRMAGREVFRHAVTKLAAVVDEALAASGLGHEDVRWLVPHQANLRIIESAAKRLKLPPEKVFINVHKYGNTSGASVPLGLYEAVQEGRLKKGQIVMTVGFGAGLVWGANLIRW